MTGFIGFDSMDEMQAYLETAEREAFARINPVQRWVMHATDETVYWVRSWEHILIFGEAWTAQQMIDSETEHGADEDEAKHSAQHILDQRRRGYLFGKAWSVIEPRGELGTTHVSEVVPIPFALFEYARRNDWTLPEHDIRHADDDTPAS
jgi:hypothetical protein